MPDNPRWEWARQGVTIEHGHILWYENEGPVRFASGAACTQEFDDFLARGPQYDQVPPDVLEELTAAVRKLVK